jgi:aryl carrier-like protein
VGVEDNFFELGGHSLVLARGLTRLRRLFEIELSFRDLYQNPTIAAQANLVEDILRARRMQDFDEPLDEDEMELEF